MPDPLPPTGATDASLHISVPPTPETPTPPKPKSVSAVGTAAKWGGGGLAGLVASFLGVAALHGWPEIGNGSHAAADIAALQLQVATIENDVGSLADEVAELKTKAETAETLAGETARRIGVIEEQTREMTGQLGRIEGGINFLRSQP